MDREKLNGLHGEINGTQDGLREVINIYQQHAGHQLILGMQKCIETPIQISKHMTLHGDIKV